MPHNTDNTMDKQDNSKLIEVQKEVKEMNDSADLVDNKEKNYKYSTPSTNGYKEEEEQLLSRTKIEDDQNGHQNGLLPQIEISHKSTSNSSSSSESEKTDSEIEKKKQKRRSKRKGSSSDDDSPRLMRRRIKELEQIQRDYMETRNLLDALHKSNAELIKELENEKQKNKKQKEQPVHNEKNGNMLQEIKATLDETSQQLAEKEAKIKEKDSTISSLKEKNEELNKTKGDLESGFETLRSTDDSEEKQEVIRQFNQERIKSLQKALREKDSELTSLKANLDVSGKRIQQLHAENSKLEAKLSNAETLKDAHEGEMEKLQLENSALIERIKKLEEQISKYKEKIKADSLSKTEREQVKITQNKLNERITELEQKVIDVNGRHQKLQGEYQDALIALEAADQAYKQRDVVIEKYKSDIDEAESKTKAAYKELEKTQKDFVRLEQDVLKTKLELKKAEEREQEKRTEREELKDQVKRAKEKSKTYQAELEDVRTDLSEMTHEMNMAQARAKERGKKNQILQLELTEVKDTLQIARNVISEKEKNMETIKENLNEEKEKVKKLQQDIERLEHVQTQLRYVEEDKARLDIKLANSNKDLVDIKNNLDGEMKRRKESEQKVAHLEKENKTHNKKIEETESELRNLSAASKDKDTQLEEQMLELIEIQEQLGEANQQFQELYCSYEQDRERWEKWAKRAVSRGQGRRRPKSAPSNKPCPPAALPGRYEMYSPSYRRMAQKLGTPRLNPSYINSCHKVAWSKEEDKKQVVEKTQENNSEATQKHLTPSPPFKPNIANLENVTDQPSNSETSRLRFKRPASSYGIRSQPKPSINRPYEDPLDFRELYNNPPQMYMDSEITIDEEELFAKNVVHKGDRVMIQSQVVGDGKLNVTGVVKYVGRVGRRIPSQSIYVGLKLDQPIGDNSGKIEGKQLFTSQPRHDRFVRLSDIHPVMNPRTQQYNRMIPVAADHLYR